MIPKSKRGDAKDMKLVINRCYGGFCLSDQAYERLGALGIPIVKYQAPENDGNIPSEHKRGHEAIFDSRLDDLPRSEDEVFRRDLRTAFRESRYFDAWTFQDRSHPLLVRVVEELGQAASGLHAELAVIEIPDDVEWQLCECEGREWVAEKHRRWD
jgi:hypothetical protein